MGGMQADTVQNVRGCMASGVLPGSAFSQYDSKTSNGGLTPQNAAPKGLHRVCQLHNPTASAYAGLKADAGPCPLLEASPRMLCFSATVVMKGERG